ncbi:E3 ubiquitin-protein ligase TRIM39-like isoform 2-T2 [Pholidichthys leucotaenia]
MAMNSTGTRARRMRSIPNEATISASVSESGLLEEHITCCICKEVFENPVTTPCGHSFCAECLQTVLQLSPSCPLCNAYIHKIPGVNIALRDIIQQLKQNMFTGGPGEVPCDICTEKKLKAKKSCLVCLSSYCFLHLDNHYTTERLKGHKLVEPVDNLDQRACLKHGRPLELYSRTQQTCICARCVDEGHGEVVSAEEECSKKKTELGDTKTALQHKVTRRKSKLDELKKALKACKDQLDNEWWDIENVFTAILAIVEAAQKTAHKPLDDRRQVLEKEAKGLKNELEAEIGKLEKTISELDDISSLEDHILFLKKYQSLQDMDDVKDWSQVELNTTLSFGTIRKTTTAMMEQIQKELEKLTSIELKRVTAFPVDIKLDPDTAHQRLILSNSGKEVEDGGQDQNLKETPERFDYFCSILGLNSLTSGRAYWEVKVGSKTGWDLGVARGGANHKGKLTMNPDNGYWVIVHYEGENYAAMTAPPLRLSVEEKPETVGVFVDYEEGVISFFNVTAQSHIYSFTECSFRDEIYPYFSPHLKHNQSNAEPLVISTPKCGGDDAEEDLGIWMLFSREEEN